MIRSISVFALLLILFAGCSEEKPTEPEPEKKHGVPALHTDGRWFVDENDSKVILRGVNIPSMEWTAGGDYMLQSVNQMIDVWGANLLRIPLAQDRWFGHTSEQRDSGAGYRALVRAIVDVSDKKGAYVLLELHWSDGNQWGRYIGQHIMPDENSILFWQDLAEIFKDHPAVMFGLYNEPYGVSWDIWLDGGEVTENYNRGGEQAELTYRAVGHQELYDTIRTGGAGNIIVAGGLDWGYDLSGILSGYALKGENIAYDTHPYPWKDRDWDGRWGDVGRRYPLIVGEWGGTPADGHMPYGIQITDYMRRHKFSWTAWCLHPSAGPQLIEDWQYNPTWFGELVIRELADPVDLENDGY
jgi:hypothetical protein